jgi:hypothetical protein
MADFIQDAPKSGDAEARALLALNSRLRRVSPRETSNGSVAKGGKRISTPVSPRGGKQ